MGCWKVAGIVSTLMVGQAGMPALTLDGAVAAPIVSESGQSRQEASLQEASLQETMVRLVGDFVRAQQAFDVPGLTALTTPDYLEISPVGEVDSREKMLGFYAPDKKTSAPPVEIGEPVVRVFGSSAIIVVKLAYMMQPPGQPPRVMALRASFVAHRDARRWRLASAQYTAIRPAAK